MYIYLDSESQRIYSLDFKTLGLNNKNYMKIKLTTILFLGYKNYTFYVTKK